MTHGGIRTFVIHILVPLRTHPPSTALAVVFILTTSEPAECSDIARAPTFSPDISSGKNLAFCAAVPLSDSWLMHSCEWAEYDSPMLPDALLISSMTIQWAW